VNRARSLLLIVLAVVAFYDQAWGSESIRFPSAKTDAQAAGDDFDLRARAVIAYNACARELEYAQFRLEQKGEEYGNQGENLTGILIAKIRWLTDPGTAGTPCRHDINRERRSDVKAADFAATTHAWFNTLAPTRCAFPTSDVRLVGDRITGTFRVDPGCLRVQVNEAIVAMAKDEPMGTGVPCVTGVTVPGGDFDVTVRDLTRILYMGTLPRREVLIPATITYMYENLLAARGRLARPDYSPVTCHDDPAGDDLGTPEDYADREHWYAEVLDTIGDVLEWLWHWAWKALLAYFVGVVASVVAGVAAIFAVPLQALSSTLQVLSIVELLSPILVIRIPETENHRLMIESSKYLTNTAIIRELERIDHDEVSQFREYQQEIREWLLKTLQDIAINDFAEYNSRPYTRYSLTAIANLYDFTDNPELKRASQIVLDLSAAKFAAGSNRGRRVVPFRRLAENDWIPLFEMVSGADHEVARALLLTGQTQILGDKVDAGGAGVLIYPAVSSYRAPHPVIETAVVRKKAFEQDILHGGPIGTLPISGRSNAGVEAYYSSPAFTMSLGGIPVTSALSVLGQDRDVDHGVAMPTVIIPTVLGKTMEDLFYFAGIGTEHERRANLCGWKGFICGIAPRLPLLLGCGMDKELSTSVDFIYVNSAKCSAAGAGPHFYLAIKKTACVSAVCGDDIPLESYGLMDAIDAPNAKATGDGDFTKFKKDRRAALWASVPDSNGIGTYQSASGDTIKYRITEDGAYILEVNGAPRREFATEGLVISSKRDGHIFIKSPESAARIDIDFTNWASPTRTVTP
jgi:hypothetical protein